MKTRMKTFIGIILVILIISIGSSVFADNAIIIGGNTTNTTNTVNTVNTTNNTTTNNVVNTTKTYNNTTNTTLPKTGENDIYIIVALVAVCGISAIYAYKKIRDYNIK